MRSVAPITLCSLLLLSSSAFATPHFRRGPTAPRAARNHSSKTFAPAHATVTHGTATRAGITPERATDLQTALIRNGYLTGNPSGTWDAPSQAAMEKLQADNGWQTKFVPDARAIIKLGLGPANTPTVASAPPADAHENSSN